MLGVVYRPSFFAIPWVIFTAPDGRLKCLYLQQQTMRTIGILYPVRIRRTFQRNGDREIRFLNLPCLVT